MTENHYDNKTFFDKYSQMNRSIKGLEGAGEWETLKSVLPDFKNKRVLDLGCGFGWHCQYAIEHGAKSVVGVDVSKNMLAVAVEKTSKEIEYIHQPIEDLQFTKGSFDVVISSLAFHYLESFEDIAQRINHWLAGSGVFVFSVEHPIFTAQGSQDWCKDQKGNIQHFPVDNYFIEGKREANFLGETVTKYHKTLTTYLNTLLHTGFELTNVIEPQPPQKMLEESESMRNELRRPMMLIVSARKK